MILIEIIRENISLNFSLSVPLSVSVTHTLSLSLSRPCKFAKISNTRINADIREDKH